MSDTLDFEVGQRATNWTEIDMSNYTAIKTAKQYLLQHSPQIPPSVSVWGLSPICVWHGWGVLLGVRLSTSRARVPGVCRARVLVGGDMAWVNGVCVVQASCAGCLPVLPLAHWLTEVDCH
jgi:hypothetical protein